MHEAYLAIDLGAESGRAVLGVLEEEKLRLEVVHRFPHEMQRLPTGLHWDITGLWREICAGLRAAGHWAREHDVRIASIGVDTWGVDWALVGKSGELIGLPHAYRDPRNEAAHAEAVERLGVETIYNATGIQFLPFNSLYSLYAQAKAGPELLECADQLLFIPDLLHYWLSGKRSVEATIASTSQMIDCRTGDWSSELVAGLGLPARLLRETSPPGTTLGTLREEIAKAVDLPADTTVVLPGSHDTASAVAAVPARAGSSWCYLSSGTWSLLGAELNEPCTSEAARGAMFTNELGVGGRYRFLKNISGLWLVQECRRDYARLGQEYDYAELTAQAAAAEPFGTLVDPNHASFATPGGMLEKMKTHAAEAGEPVPETPGQFVRAALESLALLYRQTLATLEQVLERQFEVLHIVGGGGQNELLNQMTADAAGREVRVGPYEATATGNLLVQAMAAGRIGDLEALREVVAGSTELSTYQPADSGRWAEAEERFKHLTSA